MILRQISNNKIIERNEKANEFTNQAAMIGRVRFEKWSFLFYINIVINEIIIEKLNKWFYLRENEKHLNRKN